MKRFLERFARDFVIGAVVVGALLVLMASLDARARRIHAQELAQLYAVARAECAQQRDDTWRELDQRTAGLTPPVGMDSVASSAP